MRLTESIINKLNEDGNLSVKDYIESEYGLKLNTCAVRSKEQGIPSGLRDFLDVAKEIGLNVDDVSYGFPSLEDNYVGDSKTNIQVLSSAIDGKPIIGKIICTLDNYDENKVKSVAKEIIGTDDLGNDKYNIFLDNGDWSLQGVKGEDAGVYYYGNDKKGALNKLQSLNESDLLNKHNKVVNEEGYFKDKDIEKREGTEDKKQPKSDVSYYIVGEKDFQKLLKLNGGAFDSGYLAISTAEANKLANKQGLIANDSGIFSDK